MSKPSQPVILITGASRGTGAAIARACTTTGAKMVLHYSSNHAAMDKVAAELGDAVLGTVSMDLSVPDAGKALWAEAKALAPSLNALVNNAGIAEDVDIDANDADWDENWQRTLAVNLQAPADLCRAAILDFKQQGGGSIINIASRAGQRGDKLYACAYSAAKGGLIALTRTIAKGAAQDGILAYAIAPGWIETEMAPPPGPVRDNAMAEIPLGKFADPRELGDLCAFLLSGKCPSATGAVFDVNGASHLR